MKTETIEKLKEAFEAQHRANEVLNKLTIDFLDELCKDWAAKWNGGTAAAGATVASISRPEVRTSELVRRAIEMLQDTFCISDVVVRLQREFGKKDSDPVRGIIRNEISKLRYAEKLEVVEPGKGSRSGVYRKKVPLLQGRLVRLPG